MRPVLFGLHWLGLNLQVHSYGVAIAAGFLVAIFLGIRQARRLGEDPDLVQELCFWLLVSSMLGARLLYVVTNVPTYVEACRDAILDGGAGHIAWACSRALHVWEGGLVFYGGLLAATAFAIWYTRRRGANFRRIADLLAPMVALGHFFGRLGCWAAGCCYGRESHLPWALRLPPESAAFQTMVTEGKLSPGANVTPPLHPVQLYEAFGELALFFFLSWLALRKRWDGQVLVLYLALYGILRFTVEIWRGDAIRKFLVPHLSTSQVIAVGTLALAGVLYARWRR
jgi:phosphatidylglycerol---prolipoprotein diacylglyceryl transferase